MDAKRKFDQEFRDGAVRIVRETGRLIAAMVPGLGVNKGTLCRIRDRNGIHESAHLRGSGRSDAQCDSPGTRGWQPVSYRLSPAAW